MQLTQTLPSQSLEMPSLPDSIRQFAAGVRKSLSPRQAGLSVFDIDDASNRATAKSGLTVRPNPNQALRTV